MSLSLLALSLSFGREALSVYGSLNSMAQKLTFTRTAIFMASLTALNMLTPCVSTEGMNGDYVHEILDFSACSYGLYHCLPSRFNAP